MSTAFHEEVLAKPLVPFEILEKAGAISASGVTSVREPLLDALLHG